MDGLRILGTVPDQRRHADDRAVGLVALLVAQQPPGARLGAAQHRVGGREAADARDVVVARRSPRTSASASPRRGGVDAPRDPSASTSAFARSSIAASPKRGPTCEKSTPATYSVGAAELPPRPRAPRRSAPRSPASSRGVLPSSSSAWKPPHRIGTIVNGPVAEHGAAGRAPGTRSSARRGARARRGRRPRRARAASASTNAVSHVTCAERRLEVLARERAGVADQLVAGAEHHDAQRLGRPRRPISR